MPELLGHEICLSRPGQGRSRHKWRAHQSQPRIHKSKRVNTVFDILHILGNSLITLLRIDKILVMGYDPSARRRGIRLFESSPYSMRYGGGRDKLHKSGRYTPNNYRNNKRKQESSCDLEYSI